jgi:hypothetical protein
MQNTAVAISFRRIVIAHRSFPRYLAGEPGRGQLEGKEAVSQFIVALSAPPVFCRFCGAAFQAANAG